MRGVPTTGAAAALGAYVLPGGPLDPTPVVAQARAAEALGLGTVFIGERYATKDLPSLAGALSQTTSRIRIAAGVTHVGTRHPMVLASMGQTLQALSGERFVLGFGRGTASRWRTYGIPPTTNAMLADTADILRRLWAGEHVSYEGPLGTFPDLALAERAAVAPPPLLLAAVGPRTLALGGTWFDGVILHPLLTVRAVERAVQIARDAAEAAGRDPDALEIHATVIVAPDLPPEEIVAARALGYLLMRGLGDALVAANGWDRAALERARSHPDVAGLGYRALKSIPPARLAEIARVLPDEWLHDGAAAGTATACAARVQAYLDAGATHLLLHGAGPDQLGALVGAFVARRA